jgi:uncharacterized protein
MIRLLILIGIVYLAYRALKSWMFSTTASASNVSHKSAGQIDDIMVKDPFCDAYFAKRDGVPLKYGVEELYFCSTDCRDKFIAEHPAAKK